MGFTYLRERAGWANAPRNRADVEVDVGRLSRICVSSPLRASPNLRASLPARTAPVGVSIWGTATGTQDAQSPAHHTQPFSIKNIPRTPERWAIDWRRRWLETRLCQVLPADRIRFCSRCCQTWRMMEGPSTTRLKRRGLLMKVLNQDLWLSLLSTGTIYPRLQWPQKWPQNVWTWLCCKTKY